jgi:MoxR-like ATPase
LWWAFDWGSAERQAKRAGGRVPDVPEGAAARGVVVLVDEIDKADASVPNGLLDALGHGRFDAPGRDAVTLAEGPAPLVVITTNEERALPDAFLRRCLVLHLGLPTGTEALVEMLVARGKAHFEGCDEGVLRKAAGLLERDREALLRQDLAPPGLAEYIDLVRVVTVQRKGDTEGQMALLDLVSRFALKKHPPEGGR